MAARKDKKHQINLLPQEEFEGTTVGRILKWAMSTFRIIVILTEMVVMAAFLSRFWLDARNADLNDAIKQKVAVISASSEVEKEFRDTQKRLKIFSNLSSREGVVSNAIAEITSHLPPDVFLISYSYNQGSIQIKGISPSEISIAQFIVNLENSEMINKVNLTNVDTSQEETALAFTLRVELGKGI